MGQAGCHAQCAAAIGLTEKQCRDCLNEAHHSEYNGDLQAEDHYMDLQVSRTIQMVDVPQDSTTSKMARLEQEHKELELWWKQQQEQEMGRMLAESPSEAETVAPSTAAHEPSSQRPAAHNEPDAASEGRVRHEGVTSEQQVGVEPDEPAEPPTASGAFASTGAMAAAALALPVAGALAAAALAMPATANAVASRWRSANNEEEVDTEAAAVAEAQLEESRESSLVAPARPVSKDSDASAAVAAQAAETAAQPAAQSYQEVQPPGHLPGCAPGPETVDDALIREEAEAESTERSDAPDAPDAHGLDDSWLDEDSLPDIGSERRAHRPHATDAANKANHILSSAAIGLRASSHPPEFARPALRLPDGSKGQRLHSQLDNYTCELTGYHRRKKVVSARRARRLERERERAHEVLTAVVPHPQPKVPVREYKPPAGLTASQQAAHRMLAEQQAKTQQQRRQQQLFQQRETLRQAAEIDSEASSSDAGEDALKRPPSRGRNFYSWIAPQAPLKTGKCLKCTRPAPSMPSLPSLTPESLRAIGKSRKAGQPAQASVADFAASLGSYMAGNNAAKPPQGDSVEAVAVTVSGFTEAVDVLPAKGDDEDFIVTLDNAARNVDHAEMAVFGKAFVGFEGGSSIPFKHKALREFLQLHTPLEPDQLDAELTRAADGGSVISRQGFLKLMRQHVVSPQAVQKAFLTASGGADVVKAEACRRIMQQTATTQLGAVLPKPKWDKIFLIVLKGAKDLDAAAWSECCNRLFRVARLVKYAKL